MKSVIEIHKQPKHRHRYFTTAVFTSWNISLYINNIGIEPTRLASIWEKDTSTTKEALKKK